jgi:hypothetical protein
MVSDDSTLAIISGNIGGDFGEKLKLYIKNL